MAADALYIRRTIGPWTTRIDPGRTQSVYVAVQEGGARGCGCDMCLNFDWHRRRGEALRRSAVNLLAELGVDPEKEAETAHHGPGQDGYLYEWWYHAIGEVVDGPESKEPIALGAGLTVMVKDGRAVAHEGFENLPLIEVSFFRHLPWVLTAPEPP